MKQLLLIALLLLSVLGLNAQIQSLKLPKWKTSIQIGKAQNTFNQKEPFNLIQCFEGCRAIQQKNLPTFVYGGTIMRRIGRRHYVGVDYHRYQMKFEQRYEDFFLNRGNEFDFNGTLTFHGYAIAHQYKLFSNSHLLFWNNKVGLDKLADGKKIFKRPNVLYRTGFDIGYSTKRIGLYINPFLQLGLTSYFYKNIKPITYGINISIPFYF